jgi:hypothetical protein
MAVFLVLLFEVYRVRWVWIARVVSLRAVFFFTIISAIHYTILVQQRLRAQGHPAATALSSSPKI